MITIIIFLLILSFVVIIHELGHFYWAKKFGVKVNEFGLGFPPRLCQLFVWQETPFTLNLIPLGGFVSLEGETETQENLDLQTPNNQTKPTFRFNQKKPKEKFFIILAGPLANFLLGALAFIFLFSFEGVPMIEKDRIFIDGVAPNSPAAIAGVVARTQVLTLGLSEEALIPIYNSQTLIDFVEQNQGKTVFLRTSGLCDDFGQCQESVFTYQLPLRTKEQTPAGEGILGVALTDTSLTFYPWYKHLPLSIYHGFKQSIWSAKQLLLGLGQGLANLFFGQKSNLVLMGPVGIVDQLHKTRTFSQGFSAVLYFIGILSINLGIINLLPLPALDGGRLVLIILEKFFGQKKISRFENQLNYFGFFFLIFLTILITGQDIWRLLH